MISRVADHCFWLGRYLTRAESTARVLHVTGHLALDAELTSAACFRPVLVAADEEARFFAALGEDAEPDGEHVELYMTWHEDNPVSLVQSIARARENARAIREVVSLEVWQTINELYLWMSGAAVGDPGAAYAIQGARRTFQENRYGFYRHVRTHAELALGLLTSTMLHDTPLDFILLGVLLERAAQSARTLDMHRPLFASVPQGHPVVETALWLSLLRACSGFEPFMKRSQGRVTGEAVAAFLLLEPSFPRSVRFCVRSAAQRLAAIRSPALPGLPGAKAEEHLRLLEEWLLEMSPPALRKDIIHNALMHVVAETGLVCDAIRRELLGSPADAAPASGAQ